jgi:flagellar biosynthetic protein FliQ
MTPDAVVAIGQEALKVTSLVASPILLTVLAIGVLIGMFQAATSINEMTLSFVPKLIVLALVLMFAGSWMLNIVIEFTQAVFAMIPEMIG